MVDATGNRKNMTSEKFRSFIASHRLAISIVAAVVALVAIAWYVFWSMSTWAQLETSYDRWQEDVRQKTDTALKLPADTQEKRLQKKAKLSEVSGIIIASENSVCKVHPAAGWQRFITSLRVREEECERRVGVLRAFNGELQDTLDYLQADKSLADILAAALGNTDKVKETDWEAQAAVWQNAEKAVANLSVDTNFAPVKTDAISAVKGLATAWQVVAAAHKAQDKAAYETAAGKIGGAYATLAALSTRSDQQFKPLSVSLQSAYEAAFR